MAKNEEDFNVGKKKKRTIKEQKWWSGVSQTEVD